MAQGKAMIFIEQGQKGKVFQTYWTGTDANIDTAVAAVISNKGFYSDLNTGTTRYVTEMHEVRPLSTGATDFLDSQNRFSHGVVMKDITHSWSIAPTPLNGFTIDPGACAKNVLRIASNVADAETVTIGADVYEFTDDGAVTAPANIPIDISGGVTPTIASAGLVNAILASATEPIFAEKISVNEVLVYRTHPGVNATACAETMAGSNNAWDQATFAGGLAPAVKRVHTVKWTPTTQEVALGNIHFPLDFPPKYFHIDVITTSTGVKKAWDGATLIDGNRLTIDNTGSTDWAATDDIYVYITD